MQAARALAQAEGQRGLQAHAEVPKLPPGDAVRHNRALRETLYRAYVTRASDLGARPELDNTPLMREMLALRQEEARLLGYANFAEVSLVPKMARVARSR